MTVTVNGEPNYLASELISEICAYCEYHSDIGAPDIGSCKFKLDGLGYWEFTNTNQSGWGGSDLIDTLKDWRSNINETK